MINSITDTIPLQNNFSFYRITDKSIQIKSSGNTHTPDSNEVSNISKELFNSSLNLSLSEAKLNSSGLNFDLVFSSDSSEKLKAKGYYKTEEKTLGVSLNYVFQKDVVLNGEVKTLTFEAIIDLKANITKHLPSSPGAKKEDVINFVRRVVSEILKTSNNDTKILKGFTLAKEDLKNIPELDDEKAAKYIQSIVDLALIVARNKNSSGTNNEVNSKDLNYVKDDLAAGNNIPVINDFKVTVKPVDQENIGKEKSGGTT